MKGINIICFLFFVIIFSQCNKDSKVEPIVRVLPNGKYYFHLLDGGWHNYYILDNKIFNNYRDTICYTREAGYLYQSEDSIIIPFLHVENSSSLSPCDFMNDKYNGDTLIYHLTEITFFTDHYNHKGIKGEYFIRMPSKSPFLKYEGSFVMGFKPNQN